MGQDGTVVSLGHFGSGTGIHYWDEWLSGCRLRCDYQEMLRVEQNKPMVPCWKREASTIGSMFHAYTQYYLDPKLIDPVKGDNRLQPGDVLIFKDEICGNGNEWRNLVTCADEAFKLFMAWVKLRPREYFGEVLAVEHRIPASVLFPIFGINISVQMDLITRFKGGAENDVIIWDYKSAGKTGDVYSQGVAPLQTNTYYHAVQESTDWNVVQYNIEQGVKVKAIKTKVIQAQTYKQQLANFGDIKALQGYLAEAVWHKENGRRFPMLSQCVNLYGKCPLKKQYLCDGATYYAPTC